MADNVNLVTIFHRLLEQIAAFAQMETFLGTDHPTIPKIKTHTTT